MPQSLSGKHFVLKAGGDEARVRAIEMVTDLVTREVELSLPVVDGAIQLDPATDVAIIAAIDRTINPGRRFTGVVQGFGLRRGAFACSAGWDTSDIVVIGSSGADMAWCINRIVDLQGGAVVSVDEEVTAEVALPIFGLMAELPLEALAAKLDTVTDAVRDLGVTFRDPLLSLVALTGAAIPFFRICEEGYVRLKNGETVELFV
jgi:adenine deaminase